MVYKNLLGETVADFELCESRHGSCPATDAIFPNTVAIMAFGKMELEAEAKLKPLVEDGLVRLNIYTSGCQSALVAVLNAAWKLKIRDVNVMHHDNSLGGWQAQKVTTLANLF